MVRQTLDVRRVLKDALHRKMARSNQTRQSQHRLDTKPGLRRNLFGGRWRIDPGGYAGSIVGSSFEGTNTEGLAEGNLLSLLRVSKRSHGAQAQRNSIQALQAHALLSVRKRMGILQTQIFLCSHELYLGSHKYFLGSYMYF